MSPHEIIAELDARSPAFSLKRSARRLIRNPRLMERIWPALSLASAAQISAVAAHYREFHKPFVNVSALMIVARWKRKAEYHSRRYGDATEGQIY